MVRLLICTALLIALVAAVRHGLNGAFDNWGFWPGMAVCAVFVSCVIAAAFWWDRVEARSR